MGMLAHMITNFPRDFSLDDQNILCKFVSDNQPGLSFAPEVRISIVQQSWAFLQAFTYSDLLSNLLDHSTPTFNATKQNSYLNHSSPITTLQHSSSKSFQHEPSPIMTVPKFNIISLPDAGVTIPSNKMRNSLSMPSTHTSLSPPSMYTLASSTTSTHTADATLSPLSANALFSTPFRLPTLLLIRNRLNIRKRVYFESIKNRSRFMVSIPQNKI